MLDPVAFSRTSVRVPRWRRGQGPANRMIIAGENDERSPPCINNSLMAVCLSKSVKFGQGAAPTGLLFNDFRTPWDLSLASQIDTRDLRIFVTCQSPI